MLGVYRFVISLASSWVVTEALMASRRVCVEPACLEVAHISETALDCLYRWYWVLENCPVFEWSNFSVFNGGESCVLLGVLATL